MDALSGCASNRRMTVIELLDGALPQEFLLQRIGLGTTDDTLSSVFLFYKILQKEGYGYEGKV